MSRPMIGFIGLGKVGTTLARLLHQQGYTIGAVFNRTYDKAIDLANLVDSQAVNSFHQVVRRCELIFLTVSDDIIPQIASQLSDANWTDKALVHVSGVSSVDVLQPVYIVGGQVGSFHPAYPFSTVETAIRGLRGATFAIEYSDKTLRQWLIDICKTLEGHVIEISEGAKAQYHGALTIASNYMVTLYAVAQELLMELSNDKMAINNALNTLMSATMTNLVEQGIPSALTGPLVRGDIGTIESHLATIRDNRLLHDTYINLAKLSYPMIGARGMDTIDIDQLMRQDNHNATDNP